MAAVDGPGLTGVEEASVSGCSSRSRSAALKTTIVLGCEIVEVPVGVATRPVRHCSAVANEGEEAGGASIAHCLATELLHFDTQNSMRTSRSFYLLAKQKPKATPENS